MQRASIIVRLQEEFIHRYKDAPEEVRFLCDFHRHVLFIEVEIEVTELDRELEFIMVKRALQEELDIGIRLKYVDKSCETVAKEIIDYLLETYGERNITVTVFEDNENGGKVVYTSDK